MPSGPREQAEAGEPEAGLGASGGSRIKLESRAADLKKLLLGKRQKALQAGGQRPSEALLLSPSPPDSQLAGPGVLPSRQVFSDSDIGDLIADLLPPSSVARAKSNGEPVRQANQVKQAKQTKQVNQVNQVHEVQAREGHEGHEVNSKPTGKNRVNKTVKASKAAGKAAQGPEATGKRHMPDQSMQAAARKGDSSRTLSTSTTDTTETIVQMNEPVTRATPATQANGENKENKANANEANEANEKNGDPTNSHKNSSNKNKENKNSILTNNSFVRSTEASNMASSPNTKDMQDWLLFTNYYDVAYRHQFLNRRRRLAALEAERLQLLEEEKEEATMTAQRQFPATPRPSYPLTPLLLTAATTTEASAMSPAAAAPEGEEALAVLHENRASAVQRASAVAKRPREASEPAQEAGPERPEKVARVEGQENKQQEAAGAGPQDSPNTGLTGPTGLTGRTGRTGRTGPPGPPDRGQASSPLRRWNAPDLFDGHRNTHAARDAHGGGQWHRGDNRRRSQSLPRPVDLSQSGGKYLCVPWSPDTRFFILKSFNEGNVRKAMADGVWTTQMKNEDVLVEAFLSCRNVILFFSVNKSRAFQGYARMLSRPSAQTYRPAWMDSIHWESTEPFRIDWRNTCTTDFRHVARFVNEFNDRRSVIIAKDGQEMDEECGRQLMEEMDAVADEQDDLFNRQTRPNTYRRSPSLASRITGGRR